MEISELYSAIEQLNKEKKELKESREFKIGAALALYGHEILRLDFKGLYKNLSDKRAKVISDKRYTNYEIERTATPKFTSCNDKRIAVYVCVTGGYDFIQRPLLKPDNVDYILFTDKPSDYNMYASTFIVKDACAYSDLKDPSMLNRYIKLHPHEVLKEYDYSIYIDGNVRVISDITGFVNLCAVKTGIAMHQHKERSCVYQEAEVCKLFKKGNATMIDEQMSRYRDEHFPKNFGMNEATIIATDLHNEVARKLYDDWWNELISSGSMRDQLAWPYVLWKKGFALTDVGNLGNDVYKNYKVDIVKHKK